MGMSLSGLAILSKERGLPLPYALLVREHIGLRPRPGQVVEVVAHVVDEVAIKQLSEVRPSLQESLAVCKSFLNSFGRVYSIAKWPQIISVCLLKIDENNRVCLFDVFQEGQQSAHLGHEGWSG